MKFQLEMVEFYDNNSMGHDRPFFFRYAQTLGNLRTYEDPTKKRFQTDSTDRAPVRYIPRHLR